MPAQFRCVQGHRWEDLFEPSLVDGAVRCPECGATSHPDLGDLLCPTGEVPPVRVAGPAAAWATRVVPSVNAASETPIPNQGEGTVFVPRLADAPAVDQREHDLVVAPSHRLAEPASSPRCNDWPDVPGYEIESELGRGGMGVVYKARQTRLNRVVALKMILSGSQADERDRARFHAEAQAVARLQHPNIVQIFEVGEHSGQAYFSLEFVDGGSLAERLRGDPVPVPEAARLVQVLAEAMHFAHQHGIVHRDLKPANILLGGRAGARIGERTDAHPSLGSRSRLLPAAGETASAPSHTLSLGATTAGQFGTPKITDFGLAKDLDQDIHNTRSGMVVGTPSYMAPEQATGSGVIGPAADIYALGVLLYQLLTHRLPFSGDSPMDVLIKVTQQEPPPPSRFVPRLARDLETICLKCLEKRPARRYASAQDLAEDLRRFLAHEPILARPVTAWERAARWAKRHPAVTALLAVVLLALVGLGLSVGRAAQAERDRVEMKRAEAASVLERARAEAAADRWANVQQLLAEPRQHAPREKAVAELAGEIESLAAAADRQLTARARARAFAQARDEALFQASLATTGSTRPQWELTRRKILFALGRVGATALRGPQLDELPFTAAEQEAIRQGCYELLLGLADASAVALPGEEAHSALRAREALATLKTAASLGLKTHAYHLRRAHYLDQAGEPSEAARERGRARALSPTTDLDHYLIGGEHLRAGDLDRAARAFLEALRLRPDHFWARYSLARVQVMTRELPAARDNLTSCLSQSKVVWIYLLRGLAQGQLPNGAALAEADFEIAWKALQKEPDEGALYALYNNRAITRLKRGADEEARRDLRAAIRAAPRRHQAYLTLAQALRERKELTEAITVLTRGLEMAAEAFARKELAAEVLYHFYQVRAQSHLQARLPDSELRALMDYGAILRLPGLTAGARAGAHRARGHQLFRAGNVRQALQEYDWALRLTPQDAALHRWRAEALLKQRRYAGAVAAYDRHLDLLARAKERGTAADRVRIYRSRALALLQLGQHSRALADYNLALVESPREAELWLQRGQTYLACKAWQLAVKDFDEALRLSPKSAAAHQGRGTALLHLGKPTEAAAEALAASRLAGQDARLLHGTACLLTQAAGQMAPRKSDGGTGPRDAASRLALSQALGLLERTLEAVPLADRKTFWRDLVSAEPALRPLTALAGYGQLERRYKH